MDTLAPAKTRAVRVGADIGKRQDPAAIVVTEEQDRAGVDHYVTRLVERLPLGTAYPAVSDRIVAVVRNLEAMSRSLEVNGDDFRVECYVDATGVGLPVLDLVREAGVLARGVIFTGTDTRTERPDYIISMGKAWMVGRLQVLLQAGRLHLPIDAETSALIRELEAYEISVNERAHASFNAPSGKHDDLVIALGLSVGKGRAGGGTWGGTWLPGRDDDDEPAWNEAGYIPRGTRQRRR